jgi:hypothetical protein
LSKILDGIIRSERPPQHPADHGRKTLPNEARRIRMLVDEPMDKRCVVHFLRWCHRRDPRREGTLAGLAEHDLVAPGTATGNMEQWFGADVSVRVSQRVRPQSSVSRSKSEDFRRRACVSSSLPIAPASSS